MKNGQLLLRGKRCYCRDERAWLDNIRTLASSGWLRSRQMTAPGWLEWSLASNAAMTGAMG